MRFLLPILFSAGMCAAMPSGAVEPAKAHLCQACGTPPAGIALPHRGVMFAQAGVFSFGWRSITYDRDRHTIARGYMPSQVAGRPPVAPEYAEARLTDADAAELDAAMARVWPVPDRLPGSMATDIFWDLWLVEGDQRRHETGAGMASGAAEPLVGMLRRLAERAWPAPAP